MLLLDWNKVFVLHRQLLMNCLNALEGYDVQLICFGSTVKGTAHNRSDVDIAYRCKNKEDKNAIRKLVHEHSYDSKHSWLKVDILDIDRVTPNSPLYRNIMQGMLLKDFSEVKDDV